MMFTQSALNDHIIVYFIMQSISDQVQLTDQLLKVLFANLEENLQEMSKTDKTTFKALLSDPGKPSRKGVRPPHELIHTKIPRIN